MSTPAPTAAITAPPEQFPFIIPPSFKKLFSIDSQGQELHADDNPWVYMQRKDPFVQDAPKRGAAAAANGEPQKQEAQPTPEEAQKLFASARVELEWLQYTLQQLREGRYLTVGRVERPPVPQRMMELALETNSRYKRRTAAAAAASLALGEGAQALAALGSREDAFYMQVAQLQRYWKVKQAPPDSPYGYVVNLKLGSSTGSSSHDAASLSEASALIGRGPVSVVPIMKDSSGMLRVQVPAVRQQEPPTVMYRAPEEPPAIYTGPDAIHALLLQQLRLNAWHLVLHSLDCEITQRLGLPARLQPSVTAKAAAAAAAAAGGPQQQQQPGDTLSAAAAAAGLGSENAADGQTSTSTTAAAGLVHRSQSSGSMRHLSSVSGAGSHFTFYATLSDLVLQAVVGSAATAGQEVILEQQQQQQQLAAESSASQQQQQRGTTPVENGSLSVGSLNLELDVGGPWERAAAAAAAAGGGGGGTSGSLLYQTTPGLAADGSSSSSSIVLDPQLLSLRPLALQHLLLTQLGHLITKSYYQDKRPLENAAIAYAAAAREQQQRHRQRAGASASSSSSQGAVLMLAAVSFMTCLSRWLAHSSSRELVRVKVDETLLQYPGIVARSLPCCHSCNSAIQLQPAARAAAGVVAAGQDDPSIVCHQGYRPGPAGQQQQQQQQAVAPVLLLMADAGVLLEGASLGQSQGSLNGLEQHLRCRDVQQSVNHLVALPGILQPLLERMSNKQY